MKDLNFFSPYLGKHKEKKDEKIYFFIAYGILALVIVVTFAINIFKIISLNKDIQEYTDMLSAPGIQDKLKEAQEISDKIEILDKYENALSEVADSVARNDVVTDDLLNDISGALPGDVSFKDFKIEGYDVTISGVTHTRAAIGEFEHNLRKLSKIKDVHVDKIEKSNAVGEDYSFDMTCVLKEVK